MKIEIGKINTNVEAKYLTSLPDGVLTGTHRFKNGYHSVRLIARNELGEQDQCSFVVQIRGNYISLHFFYFFSSFSSDIDYDTDFLLHCYLVS